MAERKLIIPNVPGDALPEDLGSVLIITQHIPDEKEKQKKVISVILTAKKNEGS